jgi:hypothetical protein
MAGNAHTGKKYQEMQEDPVKKAEPSKTVKMKNQGPMYKGQVSGSTGNQPFAEPMNKGAPAEISGIAGTYNDIGELSGFITDGYLDKNGMPFGEAAKFNFLPPGMDISNQENAEIHDMPLRKLVAESYPGDGWMPTPRDVQE